jgi:hypothetical protein
MSGRPNKTENDVIKHKNEYIERLKLEIDINQKNYDANELYKQTGQVMPIIGLNDNRSIEDKLLDTEKLKQDIAKTIGTISSLTFGTNVVQALSTSPYNINNSLIIFTAQRINEIILNLKKIYSIGIKGDANDIQQLVNFIVKMYSDSNAFTKTAKNFIDVQPSGALNPTGLPNIDAMQNVKNTLSMILPQIGTLSDDYMNYIYGQIPPALTFPQLEINIRNLYNDIFEFITLLNRIASINRNVFQEIVNLSNQPSFGGNGIEEARDILEFLSKVFPQPNLVKAFFDKNAKFLNLDNSYLALVNEFQANGNRGPFFESIQSVYRTTLNKAQEVLTNFLEILNPDGVSLQELDDNAIAIDVFFIRYGIGGPPVPPQAPAPRPVPPAPLVLGPIRPPPPIGGAPPAPLALGGAPPAPLALGPIRPPPPQIGGAPPAPLALGNGISKEKRRRGRPKGTGVLKPYSQTVSENLDLSRGIEPTGKFIKFGKYLLNSHKLNKDNTFSLKHISGGNIIDIPSQRLTENLSKAIRTIIGGGNPSYNDLNKLTENEKKYLHKICQKSNIIDKLSIPTPSKDEEEKEIHKFEVMKGEISSGNDSPELIKEFKRLILKLQKNNSLPKKEVYEILEELNTLGY